MKIIHYSFIILGTKYACCLLTNAFVNLILFFVMGLEKTTQKPPNYSAMGMDAIRMCIYYDSAIKPVNIVKIHPRSML